MVGGSVLDPGAWMQTGAAQRYGVGIELGQILEAGGGEMMIRILGAS